MPHVKDAYYFSHDSNALNDPNICDMRADYGMEGYGIYWAIIEMLRDQADYRLKLCKCNAIAMRTNCDKKMIEEFVHDCINKYELLSSDDEYFWSDSLLRRMQKLDDKSEKARQAAMKRWDDKHGADAMQTQCKRNAIKTEHNITEHTNGDAENLFEELWQQYPRKKGKGQISDSKKKKLYSIGKEEMLRVINRYKQSMKKEQRPIEKYQYGSTFFNSGYIDYLDANYTHDKKEGDDNWRM